jgi:hypothetical protein
VLLSQIPNLFSPRPACQELTAVAFGAKVSAVCIRIVETGVAMLSLLAWWVDILRRSLSLSTERVLALRASRPSGVNTRSAHCNASPPHHLTRVPVNDAYGASAWFLFWSRRLHAILMVLFVRSSSVELLLLHCFLFHQHPVQKAHG